jgi:hypothetical protein
MVVSPLNLTPTESWPPPGGTFVKYPTDVIGVAMDMNVSLAYAQQLLQLPSDAGNGHLNFDQLSLLKLSQGFLSGELQVDSSPRRMLKEEVDLSMKAWTLLMWSVSRCMQCLIAMASRGCTGWSRMMARASGCKTAVGT